MDSQINELIIATREQAKLEAQRIQLEEERAKSELERTEHEKRRAFALETLLEQTRETNRIIKEDIGPGIYGNLSVMNILVEIQRLVLLRILRDSGDSDDEIRRIQTILNSMKKDSVNVNVSGNVDNLVGQKK